MEQREPGEPPTDPRGPVAPQGASETVSAPRESLSIVADGSSPEGGDDRHDAPAAGSPANLPTVASTHDSSVLIATLTYLQDPITLTVRRAELRGIRTYDGRMWTGRGAQVPGDYPCRLISILELNMKHLYVVTHAQSQHHVDGLVGGWYDSPLTTLGMLQATRIAGHLSERVPENTPVEISSSDLTRAYQTAEPIAKVFRAPIEATADLREKSYGEAEGKPQSWLDDRFVYPPAMGNRMDHFEGIAGSETRRQLGTRVYRAVERILANSCSHQIVVTHGGALTFVIAAWVKMPLDSAGSIAVLATSGGITHLVEDDVYHNRRILFLNQTFHLD